VSIGRAKRGRQDITVKKSSPGFEKGSSLPRLLLPRKILKRGKTLELSVASRKKDRASCLRTTLWGGGKKIKVMHPYHEGGDNEEGTHQSRQALVSSKHLLQR